MARCARLDQPLCEQQLDPAPLRRVARLSETLGHMMRPWIIDARELDINQPVERDQILSTPAIEDFLDFDNKNKTVVAAPKGYGKTLLIKYKRHSYEDRGYLLIPQNTMVDVGPGTALAVPRPGRLHARRAGLLGDHLGGRDSTVADQASSAAGAGARRPATPGERCAQHHCHRCAAADAVPDLRTAASSDAAGIFAAKRFLQAVLLPAYGQIHRPTATFIDNIDEFFVHHIANRDSHSTYHGVLEPSYWYHAQLGLVSAIYLLRAQNPHAKVYAAIRIEAFNALRDRVPNAVNLLSQISVIHYDRDALIAIFRRNIELERARNLAMPDAKDPFERFLGPDRAPCAITSPGRRAGRGLSLAPYAGPSTRSHADRRASRPASGAPARS